MKAIERAAIARVLIDLIKADKVIDSREMELYRSLKSQFSITRETEIEAYGLTLGQAVAIIREMAPEEVERLMKVFGDMTASDGFCPREEALLMLMLHFCLARPDLECDVISNEIEEAWFDDRQVLYVESHHDKEVNFAIASQHRAIERELKLCGFDFVYIPKVVQHYVSTPRNLLKDVVSFLSPSLSEESRENLVTKARLFKTDTFCVDQLGGKLGFAELADTIPALMFRVSQSRVGEKVYANFLRIELGSEVLERVVEIVDVFLSYYGSDRVVITNKRDEKGSFLYKGFYRQFFELLLLQKGVKSQLQIDVAKGTLLFPEIDLPLQKVNRKEKAFFVLFVYEAFHGALKGSSGEIIKNGGINFTPPSSSKSLSNFNRRMDRLQRKYTRIYAAFGGEGDKAPDITNERIRLPMISTLRKAIRSVREKIYEAEDLLIERDSTGSYSISAPKERFIYRDASTDCAVPIIESRLFLELDKIE